MNDSTKEKFPDKTEVANDVNGQDRLGRYGVIKKKGIYVVPSLITSAAFFCGFYAIISSVNGHYVYAAWAIILAMFFDGIDGRVARATNTTSEFGVEFDSLSDLIAFGAAPAILMYNWTLTSFGKIGWMAGFLFALCGALRLARFNTQTSEVHQDRFVGLPIPVAAGLLASIVLLTKGVLEVNQAPAMIIVALIYLLALLMVSNIPYRNFKHVDLSGRKKFRIVVGVILAVFVVVMFPHLMLFAMAAIFVAHGPVEWLWEHRGLSWQDKILALMGLDINKS